MAASECKSNKKISVNLCKFVSKKNQSVETLKRLTGTDESFIIQKYRLLMITKEEILESLAKNKPELQRQFKVDKLALFGSYARGEQGPDSDVDILVEVDPSIGLEFVTLAEKIESMLGTNVDLVSSRAVNSKAMKFIEPELIYV